MIFLECYWLHVFLNYLVLGDIIQLRILIIECILLKFHWGMKALTEVHVENVVRSTLSYPNETSKECIQFL